jgi:hypothetical protein
MMKGSILPGREMRSLKVFGFGVIELYARSLKFRTMNLVFSHRLVKRRGIAEVFCAGVAQGVIVAYVF